MADCVITVAVEPPERVAGMRWVDAQALIHPHIFIEVERAVPAGVHDAHKSIGDRYYRVLEIFRCCNTGLHDFDELFPFKPFILGSIPLSKQQAPQFLERTSQRLRVLRGITTR